MTASPSGIAKPPCTTDDFMLARVISSVNDGYVGSGSSRHRTLVWLGRAAAQLYLQLRRLQD
jgi:hypothetical protein